MRVTSFPLGPIETNSYILDDGKNALSIDVGGDPAPILDFLSRKTSPCSRPSSRTSISIISTACTPCRKNSVRPATARKATPPSKTRNQQKADSGGYPGFPNSGKSIS